MNIIPGAILLAASTSSSSTNLLPLIIVLAAIVIYWTPVIVAAILRAPRIGRIVVINALLGWTLAGWIVALVLACRSHEAS